MDSGKVEALSFIAVHMVKLRHLITFSWSIHTQDFRVLCNSRDSYT